LQFENRVAISRGNEASRIFSAQLPHFDTVLGGVVDPHPHEVEKGVAYHLSKSSLAGVARRPLDNAVSPFVHVPSLSLRRAG
jgi:hypothetical protein